METAAQPIAGHKKLETFTLLEVSGEQGNVGTL